MKRLFRLAAFLALTLGLVVGANYMVIHSDQNDGRAIGAGLVLAANSDIPSSTDPITLSSVGVAGPMARIARTDFAPNVYDRLHSVAPTVLLGDPFPLERMVMTTSALESRVSFAGIGAKTEAWRICARSERMAYPATTGFGLRAPPPA